MALSATDHDRVDRLIRTLESQLDEHYAPPNVKRDAHPKMHGCVQARFDVDPEPSDGGVPDVRRGVFGEPGPYKAWVRFSNAFGIQHDLEAETRGMAIKLLDARRSRADGEEIDDDRETQDFLLATYPAFFIPNAQYDYQAFAKATDRGGLAVLGYFLHQRIPRGLWALLRSALVPAMNPLDVTYYSQTPYQFGDEVAHGDFENMVKLRARPCSRPALTPSRAARWRFLVTFAAANLVLNGAEAVGVAAKQKAEALCDRFLAPHDFLRQAMMATLAHQGARFEIAVQFRRRGDASMPEDDATRTWSELRSPFRRVGWLTIPRQVFWPQTGMPAPIQRATMRMMTLGENMSFTPWHARAEHRPRGTINEMRRNVYRQIAAFRRGRNHVPQPVPTVAEYDALMPIVQTGLVAAGQPTVP